MKKTISLLVLFLSFYTLSYAQSSDLGIIKKRIVNELTKSKIIDSQVKNILSKMKIDGGFNGINYADLSTTAGFPQGRHTSDLAYLALAYQSQTSAFYKSQIVKEAIIKGIDFWVKNDFVGDNWHNNQITTPTNLMNLMLTIGDELPNDLVEKAQPMIGRANMSASGARLENPESLTSQIR